MKSFRSLLLIFLIVVLPLVLGMASPTKMTDARKTNAVIKVETEPNLEIHEGYVSQKEETILVKKGRKTVARILIGKPVMVAQADQEETWGYYQFPSIGRTDDGAIVVGWRMQEDSHKTYGVVSKRDTRPMMSRDEGKTWRPKDNSSFTLYNDYYYCLSDGGTIEERTPPVKDVRSYITFPKAVAKKKDHQYYQMESLPEDLQGAYFGYRGKDRVMNEYHARIIDPGLLRYSIGNDVPVIWNGNIKQLSDNSLMAGVYPCYYKDSLGNVTESCVAFYKSKDVGHTWERIGRIMFESDGIADRRGENGFEEPAFEIFPDSTFVCVMRTGHKSPLYLSVSKDKGYTWARSVPFTPNGVKPRLLMLKNGILVLSSGRPGVQLRFCLDGTGQNWTEPIDMLPFKKEDGSYDLWDSTCGYTGILESGEDSFYLVYSDFTTKNNDGQTRKSICFRSITVNSN